MTTIALLHKHYDEQHLEEVKTEMASLGAPVIRCIWSELNNMWMAVEGSHRIRAAKDLDLMPIITDITNQKYAVVQIDNENIKINVKKYASELQDDLYQTDYIDFDEEEE